MEVSFRIDCTPSEARRLVGGPDLLPLYQLAGEALEDWLVAVIARLDPHAALTRDRAELEREADDV